MAKLNINKHNVSKEADMQTLMDFIRKHNIKPLLLCEQYSNRPYMKWSIEGNWLYDLEKIENYILNGEQTPQFVYTNKVKNKDGEWVVDTNNPTIMKDIGLITGVDVKAGTPSNLIVLDLDVNHDDEGTDGVANFKKLLEERNINVEEVMDTVTVSTPSGGLHLYYKLPVDWETVRKVDAFRLLMPTYTNEEGKEEHYKSGIDVLGNNGVIPLPGTIRNKDGKQGMYKLIKDKEEIPVLPVALQQLIDEVKTTQQGNTGNNNSLDVISIFTDGVEKGSRNEVLFRVACRVANSCCDYQMFNVIVASLGSTMCVPPYDMSNSDDFKEVNGIINSAWGYHINNGINVPKPYLYKQDTQELYFVPPPKEGEEGDDNDSKWDKVYDGYLNILALRVNVEDTTDKNLQYVLESQRFGEYSKITVNSVDLFGQNCNTFVRNTFANYTGFEDITTSKHCAKVIAYLKYLRDYRKRTNTLHQELFSNNVGWVTYNKNKYFVYPNKEEVLDKVHCDCTVKQLMKAIKIKGTTQDWVDNVMPLILKSDNGKIMLLGTLGSILIGLLDLEENAIIQLEGQTSTGKSSCLNACASVFGTNYKQDWNTTKVGANNLFVGFGSFPMIYDDLKTVPPDLREKIANLFYEFVSGKERTRSEQYGGTNRDSRTFHNILLTSGEFPVTDWLKKDEGACARVLVLEGSFLQESAEGREISNQLNILSKKYYGSFGLDWCKYLISIKEQEEDLKERYNTYREILQAQVTSNVMSRKCNTIALLQLTGELVEEMLGTDYFNIVELIPKLMVQVQQTTQQTDQNDIAFMEVVEKCLGLVRDGNISLYGEVIGIRNTNLNVKDNIFGDCIVLKPKGLNKLLEELGYNASTIKRAWGKLGYLGSINGQTTHSNIKGLRGSRGNILLLTKYQELTGQDIIEVPVENLPPRNSFAPATDKDVF